MAQVTRVLALVPDLMDRSRIDAAARTAHRTIAFVADPAALLAAAPGETDLVLLDLNYPDVLAVLPQLRNTTTVGFGSHVDRTLLDDARAAGCGEVVARSVMFRRLPMILAGDQE